MKKFTLIIMTIMIWLLSYSQGNSNYYYDGYNAHFWVNDSTSAIMIIKNTRPSGFAIPKART